MEIHYDTSEIRSMGQVTYDPIFVSGHKSKSKKILTGSTAETQEIHQVREKSGVCSVS